MDPSEEPQLVDPMELDRPETYGFRWGPMVVERSYWYKMGLTSKKTVRETRVVTVHLDKGEPVEIHVSSTGRNARVFRNGKELT